MNGFGPYVEYLKWNTELSTLLFVLSIIFFTYYYFKVKDYYMSDGLIREELRDGKIKGFSMLLIMMVIINALYLSYQALYISVIVVELILFHGFFRLFLKR